MKMDEFKPLIERMEAELRQTINELQFEGYWDAFGHLDHAFFKRVIQRVIDTQKWIPVPAQVREFIDQIQAEDEAQAKSAAKAKQGECRHEPRGNGGSHSRFTRYMLEKKEQFKGWLNGTMQIDEYVRLKAKFEKEHPGWQPKKPRSTKRGGMTRIGQSLSDVMETPNQKER